MKPKTRKTNELYRLEDSPTERAILDSTVAATLEHGAFCLLIDVLLQTKCAAGTGQLDKEDAAPPVRLKPSTVAHYPNNEEFRNSIDELEAKGFIDVLEADRKRLCCVVRLCWRFLKYKPPRRRKGRYERTQRTEV